MKTIIKYLVGFTLFFFQSLAQENSNWILGTGFNHPLGFNRLVGFSSGSLTVTNLGTYNRVMTSLTCISDTNGSLLFYTNGINVYNSIGDTMFNGTGLSPSSWTNNYLNSGLNLIQAVVTIPKPGSSTEYYLIHQSIDSLITIPTFPYFIIYATKLYYSVIDMSLNGGLGEVVQKNINILAPFDTIAIGGLTCCRHANGRDWWLISHGYQNDKYYKWLITPNGFQGTYKQSIGPIFPYGLAQCKFSPDGKKYASVIDYTNGMSHSLWYYNFDRCNGMLDSAIELTYTDSALSAGCEFSSNSKVLYANTRRYLFQWDLAASNITQSKLLIDSAQSFYDSILGSNNIGYFFLMQKAINNKIYITTSSSSSILHVINYPDSLGQNCNFIQHQTPVYCSHVQAIPNQVNFNLGIDSGSVCDSLGLAIAEVADVNFQLFSNPVTDNLQFTSKEKINKVYVFDMLGKQLNASNLNQNTNTYTVRVTDLKQGMYLLVVEDKEKRRGVSKFIKQ